MDINLHDLLLKQKALDERINTEHGVTHASTKQERFLALLVEVGELANETRAFKYWSLKGPSAREVLLDEFADGLHFFLSLALVYNIGVNNVSYETITPSKQNLVATFAKLYGDINSFMQEESETAYFTALKTFLGLGSALSFTNQDIVEGYLSKLMVNYTRQNTKY